MKRSSEPNVSELIDGIIDDALKSGASDVHFEPASKELQVKYRLDGALKTIDRLSDAVADHIIARLKVLAGLLTYRNDIPQEGRIERPSTDSRKDEVTDMRLSVFPTIHGQRAVIRIFYEHADLMELDRLGFDDRIYALLEGFTSKTEGILLLTGPAGSGKSTTLGAMLRLLLRRHPDKSIVALEDPVERVIEGVTQIQIEPNRELTFPIALRSLLRQDPEVLMIGEIRDAETARIVVEAGLTGHLLMSTMHSGSCSAALIRLLEMGLEPYQITSGIWGILNQRLVRRLCSKCKRKRNTQEYEPVGCEACHETGFSGRVLLAELVLMDSTIRKAILNRSDLETLEEILSQKGHRRLIEDGHRLVREGVTSLREMNPLGGSKIELNERHE